MCHVAPPDRWATAPQEMRQTLDRSDVTARFSVAVSGVESERLGRERGCGIPYQSAAFPGRVAPVSGRISLGLLGDI